MSLVDWIHIDDQNWPWGHSCISWGMSATAQVILITGHVHKSYSKVRQ